MKAVPLLLFILLCVACKDNTRVRPNARNFAVAKMKVDGVKDFTVSSERLIAYEIPSSSQLAISDSIMQQVEYLPLQGNADCMIGTVDDIIEIEQKLIVVDRLSSKGVYLFNREDGKYLHKIQAGAGAERPGDITSVSVDRKNKSILVLDNKMNNIFYYDLDGKFLRKQPIGMYMKEIVQMDNGNLLVFSNNQHNEHEPAINHYSLLTLKDDNRITQRGFYINPLLSDLVLFGRDHLFVGTDVFYFPRFSDTVFKVGNDQRISAAYTFKVANLAQPDFFSQEKNRKYFSQAAGEKRVSCFIGGFFENSSHIVTTLHAGDSGVLRPETILIDRSSGKLLRILKVRTHVKNKQLDEFPFASPIAVIENNFVGSVDEDFLGYLLPKKQGKQAGIQKILSPRLKKVAEQYVLNRNPVLAFYSFKPLR
jgi:hypothetical protein